MEKELKRQEIPYSHFSVGTMCEGNDSLVSVLEAQDIAINKTAHSNNNLAIPLNMSDQKAAQFFHVCQFHVGLPFTF